MPVLATVDPLALVVSLRTPAWTRPGHVGVSKLPQRQRPTLQHPPGNLPGKTAAGQQPLDPGRHQRKEEEISKAVCVLMKKTGPNSANSPFSRKPTNWNRLILPSLSPPAASIMARHDAASSRTPSLARAPCRSAAPMNPSASASNTAKAPRTSAKLGSSASNSPDTSSRPMTAARPSPRPAAARPIAPMIASTSSLLSASSASASASSPSQRGAGRSALTGEALCAHLAAAAGTSALASACSSEEWLRTNAEAAAARKVSRYGMIRSGSLNESIRRRSGRIALFLSAIDRAYSAVL
ncbi:LOW QUALITY PROTEIN: hypothetical protein SETIT_2G401500v2 [Setaria italica]|uniref:Uncharacterized protein n=1 Tax=Setaria italica TaxID=4555 RepID=A0A368Q812_SETIT|nr:LOW QUALITY PROTEIN: hypothetical protein SETIT_2G401500v2 [Setaria italica]